MIVQELIDELKTYNPNAEISRDDSETILLSFIGENKNDAGYVFIEKADYVDDRFGTEY